MYSPGSTWIYRVPAGAKLIALVIAGATAAFLRAPWQVGVAIVLTLLLYVSAGIPLRRAWRQARPLMWALGFLAIFHVLTDGWTRAVMVVGIIVVLVLLAGLVTLTTRTSDIVEAIVAACRPFERLGVDAEKVGLLLALGIRSVPVIVGLAEEVREAQRARGLNASARAFAVPLLVRSLRHADTLGDALIARGAED